MRRRKARSGAMLDLWRPLEGAGDPIGCLATTYTFAPELFDEQCLARFLEIESDPDREDLAFLLERESRLGSVYAGVLADQTQAGVAHSLRWYVLPVRIPGAKQHAKLSLLAWSRHIRIIVASANLTYQGYRSNHEVAAVVDLTPEDADTGALAEAITFLRRLFLFVPGASRNLPEIVRGEAFLDQVMSHAGNWKAARQKNKIRQELVFTIPVVGSQAARSSLDEAIRRCRRRGGSPTHARIASPFFDVNDEASEVAASLCKLMARGGRRALRFAVPAIRDDASGAVPRLAAPVALLRTPGRYQGTVTIEMLPDLDIDKNPRLWHAKMLALKADRYLALMIGSSNFTRAGLGVGRRANAEANLLTIVERVDYGREKGQLEAVWPEMDVVDDPKSAEWLGAQPENEEEERDKTTWLPAGFLSATYRAGDTRRIVLRFDADYLPNEWRAYAYRKVPLCGLAIEELLLSSPRWREEGSSENVEVVWEPVQPPQKLLVRWDNCEAFLPLNVEDGGKLPPPAQLEHMSADDMLGILAASDPSAAFRAWARQQQPSDLFDSDVDSATPIDLDPLQRYDLQATFLHRIRRRARVLTQLRANLERPVFGLQALEWRLWGLIGIEVLADRLTREFAQADSAVDEALLKLADFLIVLREVDYQSNDGSLGKPEFQKVFRPFLRELAEKMERDVELHRNRVPGELMEFWKRVVEQCRK